MIANARDGLVLLLAQSLIVLIRWLPYRVLRMFVGFLSCLAATLPRKEIAQFYENMANIWGLPKKAFLTKIFLRQCVRHNVLMLIETIKAVYQPSLVKVEGGDELRQIIREAEQGNRICVLMLTAHIGSWELCAKYVVEVSGRTLYALAKPPKYNPWMKYLQTWRNQFGSEVLWTNRKKLLRDMIEIIQTKKGLLGFVMDQKPEGRVGPEINFFGKKVAFVSGPATLAIRYKLPCVTIFCLRLGRFHYKLVSKLVASANHSFNDEQKLTQIFAEEIEQIIRRYPEQWTWSYKRWKPSARNLSPAMIK